MNILTMWTVYDHPADYPDYFVARKWVIQRDEPKATGEMILDASLERLRMRMPLGLYCLPRAELDDPVIVETWV